MAPRLDRHLALVGFMGAGKTTIGRDAATLLGRPFVDLDEEVEARAGMSIARLFRERGEPEFRALEEALAREVLDRATPVVLALGGGAPATAGIRARLAARAITVLVDIGVDEAWRRARGSERPLASDEGRFRELYDERAPLYAAVADTVVRDAHDAVLAAGEVGVELGGLERFSELVPSGAPAALVCDGRVAGIHGPSAQAALGAALTSVHELPQGEDAKTLAALERLLRELTLDRWGRIVALGGGATTDAAGFAAAVYLRGIEWVAVPTTLVGQVDASIGGKTAANLPEGKNLVGAFHWPERTLIDAALLATLPERERREGLAEVVKTGLLAGEPLWELPEPELVRRCAAFKTAVCMRDPRESGERAILNLGHTFAHALEAGSDHRVSHGSAVALGLGAALRLSGLEAEARTVDELLHPEPVAADRERAWRALKRDKKGAFRLVLLERPGRPRIATDVPERDVRRALDALIV